MLKKNPVHDNRLKKFWLQDPCFDILKNNDVFENDHNLDVDILKNRENNKDWISTREEFAIIV